MEATSPDGHAYLMAWIVKTSDEKSLTKDLETTLKDSMKSVDKDTSQHELDQNGSHFYVISGSGVDKRAGTKVKFPVGIFAAANQELRDVGLKPLGNIGEASLADADAVADHGDGDIGGFARLRGHVALSVVFKLADHRGIG